MNEEAIPRVGPQRQKREPNTEAAESRAPTFVCDRGFQTCSRYGQGSDFCALFCRAEALKWTDSFSKEFCQNVTKFILWNFTLNYRRLRGLYLKVEKQKFT